jgi:ubiquinone/menaquinone biosynthesis C-methylase UbiE
MKTRTQRGFDFLAPFYEAGVRFFFGESIYESQVFFLSRFPGSNSVLILGGGSGRLLSAIALENKPAHICYIDISPKMILKARERITQAAPHFLDRIDFVCGSVADIPANKSFDLIITPYVLDCIPDPELEGFMSALLRVLKEGGFWLFSDFNIPVKGFQRIRALLITRILYFFFNFVCNLGIRSLPDFEVVFHRMGLRKIDAKYFRRGLLTSKVYERI